MKKRILVLFAHPKFEKSRINKYLIEGMKDISGLTFHNLYQSYPDLDIDVQAEQELLKANDIIVFHHPFFWYSTPAILKEWQDLVLTRGWAYGSQGTALKGKYLMNVVSTGGKESVYSNEGANNFTMRQFFAPLEQSANLCKMTYLPPYTIHDAYSLTTEDLNSHKKRLFTLYDKMISDEIDLNKSRDLERINSFEI